MKSTGELEREAADALRPIVEHALAELGLGHTKADLLMRQIAEAYVKGRAEEINLSADEANSAPSAEGIAIALALEHRQAIPTAGSHRRAFCPSA